MKYSDRIWKEEIKEKIIVLNARFEYVNKALTK